MPDPLSHLPQHCRLIPRWSLLLKCPCLRTPRDPVLDGVLLDHLTPADVNAHHTECPLLALLTDTAGRFAEKLLRGTPNLRTIEDW